MSRIVFTDSDVDAVRSGLEVRIRWFNDKLNNPRTPPERCQHYRFRVTKIERLQDKLRDLTDPDGMNQIELTDSAEDVAADPTAFAACIELNVFEVEEVRAALNAQLRWLAAYLNDPRTPYDERRQHYWVQQQHIARLQDRLHMLVTAQVVYYSPAMGLRVSIAEVFGRRRLL